MHTEAHAMKNPDNIVEEAISELFRGFYLKNKAGQQRETIGDVDTLVNMLITYKQEVIKYQLNGKV